MAEGSLRQRAEAMGLAVEVDSAGLGAWHVGEPPNATGLAVAAARGYDNGGQRARQIRASDFDDFDLIFAMDASNLAALERQRPSGARARLALFDPDGRDVPDPYGEPRPVYEATLNQIEAAAAAWVETLSREAR